jgi:hypothetical protein
VKRREGKPQRVCQSHKGNDNSPFGCLGKATLATAVRWGNPTSETPPTTGAFLYAHSLGGVEMTKADTTTCDACGTRYVFKNYTDRCPICCPGQAREDDELDSYEQADWEDRDDD